MCKTINLSNSSFIKHCYNKYGIDQGMHNAIDRIFYKYGFKNIYYRRKIIINFLDFVNFDKEKIVISNHKLIKTIESYIFRDYYNGFEESNLN